MYPAIPFGPLTLPTGPVFFLFAVYFGLAAAARSGRRLGLESDDVWNTGLLALLAGLVVARLWNVSQFWYVYSEEPLLIFSLRPSGFALIPGLIAALLAGFAYLVRKAIHPVTMLAALASGALVAGVFLNLGDYLTGTITGLPSHEPWALPYFGEMQHPAALYRALGLIVALVIALWQLDRTRPQRTLYIFLVGWGLVHLIADAFIANAALVGPFRLSQTLGLTAALLGTALLAFDKPAPQPALQNDEQPSPVAETPF